MQRLQKVMAEAGIASRRHCEEMILDGKVKVNGKVVLNLPVMVEPKHDVIIVSGKKLRPEKKVYYLLNKPKKAVCTNSDPEGRRRAIDLLTGVRERVYPVGRLDTDSNGLLILTNDGELANQLTHPSYGIVKTYIAEVQGYVTGEKTAQLAKGIFLPTGKAQIEGVKILERNKRRSLLEIQLREGRNRQIRIMLLKIGHSVKHLTRVKIGNLTLRGLGPGKFRELTKAEVTALKRLVAENKKLGGKKSFRKKSTKKRVNTRETRKRKVITD